MAKSKPGRSAGPVAGSYPVDTGTAELVADEDNPDGWLLKLNGVQTSHVDVADPLRLDFEYMHWMGRLTAAHWEPDAKLRVLHLGGGACSLPRYLAAAYPQARQVVVEIDGRLAQLVRQWFPIPKAPLVRIRVGEAREVTESLTPNSRDLVIRDVFSGQYTPTALTTSQFTVAARTVLAPGGIYLLNCGDSPDLATAKREMATVGSVFEYLTVIADPPMLKGRRHGNVVIAGSDVPLRNRPQLVRDLLGGAVPAQVWEDGRVRQFSSGAKMLDDGAGLVP